jgi:hypothetical protein
MTKRLGWRQKAMLDFVNSHGTHRIYSINPTENNTAYSLEKRGLLRVINCGMCTATGKAVLMITGIK